MRRLRSASALTKTIATLGVLIIIQATCQLIFGSLPEVLPQFLPEDSVVIGPATVSLASIVILIVSVALTAVLWAGYRYSRFGNASSAVSESDVAAQAIGISSSLIRLLNWGLAGAPECRRRHSDSPQAGVSLAKCRMVSCYPR